MNAATSTTTRFAIQLPLIERHRKTLEWLSATAFWKSELTFFQKLLDHYTTKHADLKIKMNHYQNILLYYKDELIDSMASKLRLHEKKLAQLVISQNEQSSEYFAEHDQIMNEAEALNGQIITYRDEIYKLVEGITTQEA